MVIKQIPKAISKQIFDISSSKEIYNQIISYYKDALKHSGYNNTSVLSSSTQEQAQDKIAKGKRKYKIIWFNPTFPINVKTNVGKTFLETLQYQFPKPGPMRKIFNRNMV